MKILLVRLQIFLVLLLVFSPLLYLAARHFRPQLSLLAFDLHSRPTPELSFLHTEGRQILDQSGHPVTLRGVNLISTNWGPEYLDWNARAIAIAATDWHANVIRTRLYQSEFEANPAQFFLTLEQQILSPAREHGLYVILHPWFTGNSSLPDDKGIKMWLSVAKRYKNDPHIIYDLLAEPHDLTFSDLTTIYNQLIPQLRTISPHSLIMVTGLDWGRDINVYLDNHLPYPNLVYRSNPYNKTVEFPGYFGRIAEKYPVFLGEFGTEDKLSMSLTDVSHLLSYADNLNLGWTAWHFTASGCPCLLANEASFTPSAYGNLVKQALTGTTSPYPLPSFDPDPTRLYIYSDFLESGFADYSWGITNQFGPTLQANFHPQAGLYLNTSRRLDPSAFTSFHLTLTTQTPESFSLRFKSFDNQLSQPIPLREGLNNIPTHTINLPSISGLILEPSTTITDPTPIILDNLYFQR